MELYKSLAAFQQEVPPIYKGSKGYGYNFADWGEILAVVNPLLKKHKLGFHQVANEGCLVTTLFSTEVDKTIVSVIEIPKGVQLKGMNDFQVLGSGITYLRRYSLSALLGLVTDEDADAVGEQIPKAKYQAPSVPYDPSVASNAPAAIPEEVEDPADTLKRAKSLINEALEGQNYITAVAKKAFIVKVIGKSTIETINECNSVMDAIENEIN